VLQQKTQRPVQLEITEPTRDSIGAWIGHAGLSSESCLFPSRLHGSDHLYPAVRQDRGLLGQATGIGQG
jgi:hypothetical protein